MGIFNRLFGTSAPIKANRNNVVDISALADKIEQVAIQHRAWVRSLPWRELRSAMADLSPVPGIEWHAGAKPFDIVWEGDHQMHLSGVYAKVKDRPVPAVVWLTDSGSSFQVYVEGDGVGSVVNDKFVERAKPALAAVQGQGRYAACRAFLFSSEKGSISVKIDLSL